MAFMHDDGIEHPEYWSDSPNDWGDYDESAANDFAQCPADVAQWLYRVAGNETDSINAYRVDPVELDDIDTAGLLAMMMHCSYSMLEAVVFRLRNKMVEENLDLIRERGYDKWLENREREQARLSDDQGD
jgi:hypothetical protein